MSKAKFRFNKETLEYERVSTNYWAIAGRVFGAISLIAVVSAVSISFAMRGNDSDQLKAEISDKDIQLKLLSHMSAQYKVQEDSYNKLIKMAQNKSKMLASIPAIQPIPNKKLRRIASGFGYRVDPIYKTRKMHKGIDFTAPTGTKIYATGDAVVQKVENRRWGYGKHIVLNHGYGYTTLYGHMSRTNVKVGQKVKRGQLIGLVGSTGKSTGAHLHYEVRKNGNAVNPVGYFYNDLTSEQYEEILKLSSNPNQSFD